MNIIMGIQGLVYPRGIRIPLGFNDQFFIIDEYTNIRPFGILFRTITTRIKIK